MAQREWVEKDFYKELGVSSDASAEEIKRAYRKLARDLHPDANPNNPAAGERFKAVSEAHNVLSDPAKRKVRRNPAAVRRRWLRRPPVRYQLRRIRHGR